MYLRSKVIILIKKKTTGSGLNVSAHAQCTDDKHVLRVAAVVKNPKLRWLLE